MQNGKKNSNELFITLFILHDEQFEFVFFSFSLCVDILWIYQRCTLSIFQLVMYDIEIDISKGEQYHSSVFGIHFFLKSGKCLNSSKQQRVIAISFQSVKPYHQFPFRNESESSTFIISWRAQIVDCFLSFASIFRTKTEIQRNLIDRNRKKVSKHDSNSIRLGVCLIKMTPYAIKTFCRFVVHSRAGHIHDDKNQIIRRLDRDSIKSHPTILHVNSMRTCL